MLAGLARVVTKNIGRGGRRKLGGLAGIKDLINSGVTSGLTSGVFTLAATGDPTQALAYGAADALGSTAAMGGLRRARGTKREMIYKKDPKTGKEDDPCGPGFSPGAVSGVKTKIGPQSGRRVSNCEPDHAERKRSKKKK